jgi:hypothetical protein
VSAVNEEAWRRVIVEICAVLIKRGQKHIDIIDGLIEDDGLPLSSIRVLWDEEVRVASRIMDCIRLGVEF